MLISHSAFRRACAKRHLAVGAPLGVLQTNRKFVLVVKRACLRVCLNKWSVYRNTGMCIITK